MTRFLRILVYCLEAANPVTRGAGDFGIAALRKCLDGFLRTGYTGPGEPLSTCSDFCL